MLKTIKTTKHMRLDELIKYVWENKLYPNNFKSVGDFEVKFDDYGLIKFENDYIFNVNSSFVVEVEEEITKDMRFIELVERYELIEEKVIGAIQHNNVTMRDVLSQDYITGIKILQIYALIDNKLELIWDRSEEEDD